MKQFETEKERAEYINEAMGELINGVRSFLEEAELIEEILLLSGMTQKEFAGKIGRTQGYVSNKLRLLRLPDSVKKEVTEQNVSERHARALVSLDNEEAQLDLIKMIKLRNYTAMETELIVNEGEHSIDEIEQRKKARERKKKFIYLKGKYIPKKSKRHYDNTDVFDEGLKVAEETELASLQKIVFASEETRQATIENLNVLRKFTKELKVLVRKVEEAGMIANVDFNDSKDSIGYMVSFPKKDNMLWK